MLMLEQDPSGRPGEDPSSWGRSPQEKVVAILNNAAKGQTAPLGPVRTRGFVVLTRNIESLQTVQEWCLEQSWNDCLAARYRIRSKPVFGTLFAAFIDDSEQMRLEGSASPGKGPKRHGSVLFRESGEWPKVIASGFFEDPSSTPGVATDFQDRQGTVSGVTMLRFLARDSVLPTGRRLVLLAEVEGEPDPEEWKKAKARLFELLPERVGLVLGGAPESFSLPDDPHYLEVDLAGVETTPGPEAYAYQLAALSSDRPSSDDQLGLLRYANALARFVLHPGTKPLTIAIHGPWGKGKSSFMKLVKQSLDSAAHIAALGGPTERNGFEAGAPEVPLKRAQRVGSGSKKRALRKAQRHIVTIEFNAWRYQDSTQIWAGLASEITHGLEAAQSRWRGLLTRLAYAWSDRRAELIIELVLPAVVAALVLVLAAVGIPRLREWLDQEGASDALAQLLGGVLPAAGALIGSFWVVASRARRILEPVSERVLAYIRRPDYREQMGYQHRVLADLRFVVRRLPGKRTGRQSRRQELKEDVLGDVAAEPRIVVFIDDLDRCLDEKIMEILQAINLILQESDFYVFLGIDTQMIHRAIEAHYKVDGRPLQRKFAETYLQKIVQLPFHLPETPSLQRTSFITKLFSEAARQKAPEVLEDVAGLLDGRDGVPNLDWDRRVLQSPDPHTLKPVEDTPTELQAFLQFQRYLGDNPRELKRFVNVHRFVKIVLLQEGRPPSVEIQRKLVKWLVFCDRWPDLVDDVLDHAGAHPECGDCIATALSGVDAPGAAAFAAFPGPDDVLTANDLAPDGPLAEAASISHLIVWEAVPKQTDRGNSPSSASPT